LLAVAGMVFLPLGLFILQYIALSVVKLLIFGEFSGNFPEDRASIFLSPLFLLFLIFLWKYILDIIKGTIKKNKLKKRTTQSRIRKIISFSKLTAIGSTQVYFTFFFIILTLNGINNINFTYTYEWKYCASVNDILQDVIELNPENNETELYAGGYLNLPIYYYRYKLNLYWLTVYSNNVHSPLRINLSIQDCDFDVLQGYEEDIILLENLSIIRYYSISDTYLCKIG